MARPDAARSSFLIGASCFHGGLGACTEWSASGESCWRGVPSRIPERRSRGPGERQRLGGRRIRPQSQRKRAELPNLVLCIHEVLLGSPSDASGFKSKSAEHFLAQLGSGVLVRLPRHDGLMNDYSGLEVRMLRRQAAGGNSR